MSFHATTFHKSLHNALWRDRWNARKSIVFHVRRELRVLLAHARERVPFQRARLTKIDLKTVQLEDIPPTDKTLMMSSFNDTIADGVVKLDEVIQTDADPHHLELPILHGKYIVVKTSGTSGKPSWLVCGLDDWATLLAATYARMGRYWLTPTRMATTVFQPLRTAVVAAEHAHSMTWQGSRSAGQWAGPFGRSRFFSVVDSVDDIVDGLNEFRPEHLHAYPTAVEMLARHKLDGGKVTFEPALITVGSEPLTAIARQTITMAFNKSRLIDHYGMSECLPLSTECRLGHKHLNTDYGILEPRDSQGRPVKEGELSDHVLVTNLVNRVQPIIRYRVDDCVRITREPCPCGSVFPVVEIFSRKGSLIHLLNDRGSWQILSPPIAVDTMLRAKGVAQYQIAHVRQNEVEIRFQPAKGADPSDVADSIRNQFINVMHKLDCSNTVNVWVERVDEFQRTGVGNKLQQMISLVPAPSVGGMPSVAPDSVSSDVAPQSSDERAPELTVSR